uniref:Uncharacterized protein n=1 Tax=Schistosoma japonicum TaxID=6182 RepID=Q5C2R3_SCHJA|nr:unknown [Schistosoma japonicum]
MYFIDYSRHIKRIIYRFVERQHRRKFIIPFQMSHELWRTYNLTWRIGTNTISNMLWDIRFKCLSKLRIRYIFLRKDINFTYL